MANPAPSTSAPKHYLILQQLLPGDVFLVDSGTLHGLAIKYATSGTYTHAALYLGAGRYFEVTEGRGAYVGCFALYKYELDGTAAVRRAHLYHPEWPTVSVRRHPQIAELIATDPSQKANIGSSIYRTMLERRGFEYANWSDLADASPRLAWAPQLKAAALRLAESKLASEKTIPGMFCSAAVADILERSGFLPTRQPMKPTEISPATLASSEYSGLIAVDDCLAQEDVGQANHRFAFAQIKAVLEDNREQEFNDWLRKQRLETYELQRLQELVTRLSNDLDAWARSSGDIGGSTEAS